MKFINLDELEKRINQSKIKLVPQDVLNIIAEMKKDLERVEVKEVPPLTQELLKDNLHYNPQTGEFKWIKPAQGRRIDGTVGQITANGYHRININGVHSLLHRLAWVYMTGKWPEGTIDHIDGDKSNNSWGNLRDVSALENLKNKKKNKNNKSGFTGVYWSNKAEKWVATISANYKRISIGSFSNLEDAVEARKRAEIEFEYHENHGRES